MAMIHYLYSGFFVPHDGFFLLENARPVCAKPVDATLISQLLQQRFGDGATSDTIPDDWHLNIDSDHIICDRYGSDPEALQLVAEYAARSGSQILDLGCLMPVTSRELLDEAKRERMRRSPNTSYSQSES